MTPQLRLARSIQLQEETNALLRAAEVKARSKPGYKLPSNIPARHRAVLIPKSGAHEYRDIGPTEEAPEHLTANFKRWRYAGCSDGIAVYGEE